MCRVSVLVTPFHHVIFSNFNKFFDNFINIPLNLNLIYSIYIIFSITSKSWIIMIGKYDFEALRNSHECKFQNDQKPTEALFLHH